jgi:hypothetical protein
MKKPRKAAIGSRVAHSQRIGFDKWDMGSDFAEEIEKLLMKQFSELCKLASEENCNAWFPFEWTFNGEDGIGGDPPNDPMAIYVQLPLGEEDLEGPCWSFSLSEIVSQLIDSWLVDDKIDPEFTETAKTIMRGFREQADRIEAKLP